MVLPKAQDKLSNGLGILIKGSFPRFAIGSGLGGLAFWLAFRHVNWLILWETLQQINYPLAFLALLMVLLNLGLVTARWRWLLYPDHLGRKWFNLFAGIVIGQMVNIILPLRLGEVVRAFAVGASEDLSKTRVMMTIVVEKVVDLGLFAFSTLLVFLSLSLPSALQESGYFLIALWLSAFIGIVAFSLWGHIGLSVLASWSGHLPLRWGQKIERQCRLALEGLSAVRDTRASFVVWVLSFISLGLSAGTNYILFLAIGLPLPFIAAVLVLVMLQIGNVPPSPPANLGVFHYLVIVSLSFFAVESSVALGYALLLYTVALIPKIAIGMLLVWNRKQLISY